MSIGELGFDTEFSSDEEVEEMLSSIVSMIAEAIDFQESKASIINPQNVKRVLYTYKFLKYATRTLEGVKVSYELHEPYASMGSVSISGKNLTFNNAKWFLKATELSSNFEVYPKNDGTVQMNFGFHGLTTPIE